MFINCKQSSYEVKFLIYKYLLFLPLLRVGKQR